MNYRDFLVYWEGLHADALVVLSDERDMPFGDFEILVKTAALYFENSKQHHVSFFRVLARDIYMYYVLEKNDSNYWNKILFDPTCRLQDLQLRTHVAGFMLKHYKQPIADTKTTLRDIGKQKRKYLSEIRQRNTGAHVCPKCMKKCKTAADCRRHGATCVKKRNVSESVSTKRQSARSMIVAKRAQQQAAKLMKEKRAKSKLKFCGVQVKCVKGKQFGLFANKTFKKGDLICDYGGEIIEGHNNIKMKHQEYSSKHEAGGYLYEFKFDGKEYCIDATKSASLGRYVNHSRSKPNSKIVVEPEKNTPKLFLRANCNIKRCDEILHDYGDRSLESLRNFPWLKY